MNDFSSNRIKTDADAIAEQLRACRQAKNLKLDHISRELGIRQIYLDALERGNFDSLPEGAYGKNFLREYAGYLQLDAQKLLEMYANEVCRKERGAKGELFTQQRVKSGFSVTIPGVLKNVLVLAALALCFSYLGFYLERITSSPELTILFPAENFTTGEYSVTVTGDTEPETEIIVNGEPVLSDLTGGFSKEISLKNGINVITITAKKKYGRENVITRQILVKNDDLL